MKLIKTILFLLLSFLLFTSCSPSAKENYTEARVKKIISSFTVENEKETIESQNIQVLVEILSGPDKGKDFSIKQDPNNSKNIGVPEENTIVLLTDAIVEGDKLGYQIIDSKRNGVTLTAIIFFVIAISIIGGIKGIIFFGLLVAIFLIIYYLSFPLISLGVSPLLLTLLISIGISTLVNFLTQNSTYKLKMNILSNTGSLLIVSIFSYIFVKQASLSSLLSKESSSIILQKINSTGMISSAIILASLGGIIHVSISTLNTALDVKKNYPKLEFEKQFFNTIKYSRQVIFINFIFIFTIYSGLALPILISKYSFLGLSSIINLDTISFYIISGCMGGLGIITSGILSALIGCYFIDIKSISINKK